MTAVSSAAPSPTLLRERALPATVPLTVVGAGLLALTAAAGEPFGVLALATSAIGRWFVSPPPYSASRTSPGSGSFRLRLPRR